MVVKQIFGQLALYFMKCFLVSRLLMARTCFINNFFKKKLCFFSINLRKNISTKKLEFPQRINKISAPVEDLIRKMLVENPKDRIEWSELFEHKVNYMLEEEIEKNLHETMN